MHRLKLLRELEDYSSSCFITPEEHATLGRFVDFVNENPICFERSCRGHVTASCWLVNHDYTKVLLTHHRKLKTWLQLGGHADGNPNCSEVALKEAQEESGIENITFVTPAIFDIDIHPIPSPCEYHYDVRYLLQAPVDALYTVSGESLDLAWVDFKDMSRYSTERSVMRMNEKFLKHYL
jgi:8-oxo-dGTP pyrophosphatase MutT (NUDIX family)